MQPTPGRCEHAAASGVPPAAVEDAVQDVFLTAHQKLAGFEGRSNPATWLVGIAVRVAANARRASSRRGSLQLVDSALVDPSRGPDQRLEAQRDLQELEQVLSRLPEEQREVLGGEALEELRARGGAARQVRSPRAQLSRRTSSRVAGGRGDRHARSIGHQYGDVLVVWRRDLQEALVGFAGTPKVKAILDAAKVPRLARPSAEPRRRGRSVD